MPKTYNEPKNIILPVVDASAVKGDSISELIIQRGELRVTSPFKQSQSSPTVPA